MFLSIVNSGRKRLIPTNSLNRYNSTLDCYYSADSYNVRADYQHLANKLIVSKVDDVNNIVQDINKKIAPNNFQENNDIILSRIDKLCDLIKDMSSINKKLIYNLDQTNQNHKRFVKKKKMAKYRNGV